MLSRVRWVFLIVGIVATASTIPHIFLTDTTWAVRGIALIGSLWLVWHWVSGYERGGFSQA